MIIKDIFHRLLITGALRPHATIINSIDGITLACEMSGYLRPEIKWMKNNNETITNSNLYTVLTTGGNQTSIGTKGEMSHSIISILYIHEPLKNKDSLFTCTVPGTGLNITVPLTINESTTSYHEETSIIPPLSTSPPSSDPVSTILVTLLSILALVTVLLSIAVLSLTTAIFYCKSKESRTEVPPNTAVGSLQSMILTNNAAYSSVLISNGGTETIYEEIKSSQDDDYDDGYI